eukprot:SM000008S22364  [mRNA]  locus=s8:1270267:1283112:- [translate_table: standard]
MAAASAAAPAASGCGSRLSRCSAARDRRAQPACRAEQLSWRHGGQWGRAVRLRPLKIRLQAACHAYAPQAVLADKPAAESTRATDASDEASSKSSPAELFMAAVEASEELAQELQHKIDAKMSQIQQLQESIDFLYSDTFSNVPVKGKGLAADEQQAQEGLTKVFSEVDEALWMELGRSEPIVLKALIGSVDKAKWAEFQRQIHTKSLTRDRARKELLVLRTQLEETLAITAAPISGDDVGDEADSWTKDGKKQQAGAHGSRTERRSTQETSIVLISGFESFNVELYKKAGAAFTSTCPDVKVHIFSDRDLLSKRQEVEAKLAQADVFFGSLLFDYDQCEWLQARVNHIPVRLCFESSLELMSTTKIGSFTMGGKEQKKGMPAPIKAILAKFGGGKEEDKMVGYLSFLKIGPKLLRFVPGQKVRDLRNWLTIYGYWNQGGMENVMSMFSYLAAEYLGKTGLPKVTVKETPALGVYHPDHGDYFTNAQDYLKWHKSLSRLPQTAPVVAVLLYRKHVITRQKYIPQMIQMFEKQGIRPVPIFINGVEAHTVVRDLLTSVHEQVVVFSVAIDPGFEHHFMQESRRNGMKAITSLSKSAVTVDAVVSTIGFPLVGGPAGTMEGGRQAEIAKSILQAKNLPYIVAGPLLIQDIRSWQRDGVQGLQSVVLYALPELDGAIDAVPLGGLVGDGIHLVPERVRKLTARLKSWVNLKRTPTSRRKVAIVLYGFPPGVGATGTAALLNVPKSLERLLQRLRSEGYDLGDMGESISGEDLILLLKELDQDRVVSLGEQGAELALKTVKGGVLSGVHPVACSVGWQQLKGWIGDTLTGRMEKAWGPLHKYRGICTDADGKSVVSGLQLGNVWIGVQPLLGLEGDPMRLLFERDLTPHPQASFYKWLQNEFRADALIHFGMHGTVEWLPGSPLGNTGYSWSDVLMGNIPNLYVYAANNPSESIVAKRRGYGTIISYNVPPYGRAGLYKELASLRELISEYREDPTKNEALQPVIISTLLSSGLQSDCPFREASSAGEQSFMLTNPEEEVDTAEFNAYLGRLQSYLAVIESRLFSEGLHTLGEPPSEAQTSQYLSAYFGDDIQEEVVEAVSTTSGTTAEVREKLEELFLQSNDRFQCRSEGLDKRMEDAVMIRDLLQQNTDEMTNLIKGLNGDYVPSAVGVLPTGRNIHALDPYRMPSAAASCIEKSHACPFCKSDLSCELYLGSFLRVALPAAWERGSALASNIIDQHREQNGGQYPETIAVMLWGLDAIKTRGESVAIALALVGAHPVREGTGRVVRFALTPLEELRRPRIDVLANMSGIFRDSFANVVELLDDLFQRAGEADEPSEMNFVRKHSLGLKAQGVEVPTARIFSNPAGDYGSMVNERVGAADWESGAELGETWQSRNSFSYGRGDRGTARPEVLQELLRTTDRIVQEIDSIEYGLTDIQEYYANTGAMKSAAETARSGREVSCSVVETYGKDLMPRDLKSTLKIEYRSKLLNPKWAEKMAAAGSGGAYEISQRMTALLGWGGTANFREDWVYNQASETYALDDKMAAQLRKNNPQAFQNIVKRMLEAAGRGLWENPDPSTLERLRNLYAEVDEELEGVKQLA